MKRILTILSFLLLTLPNLVQGQNALNFDASNDIVQTTYSGVFGNNDRTFEAWIKISSSATGNNCILDYGLNAVGSRNTFMVNPNNQLSYIAGGVNTNFSSSVNAVPDDVWTHVAMVMESGTGYMYVNGVMMGSGNLSGVSTLIGNTNLRIGQRVPGGNIPFLGEIDEVRVWSVARTAAEIQSTMNTEFCVIPPTLEAYYQFNQGTANGTNTAVTNLNDNSGNANPGTLTGFALTGTTSNWVSGATLTSNISNAGTLVTSNCVPFTTLGNQTLNSTGMYQDTVMMLSGCDSIYTLDFTALSSSSSSITETACDSYTSPSGMLYDTTGIYLDTIQSAIGCDSMITINLTVNNNALSSINASACDTYTAPSGKVFTSTGIYTDTIPSMIVCDSIITIDLTINTMTNSNITTTECLSYTAPSGTVYTASGLYNDTIPNTAGCDSIIEIMLTIENNTQISQSQSACDSFVSPSGEIWTSTGIYQDTVFGGASCASVYTIDLIINSSENVSITENACGSYTSNLGNTYDVSGTYSEMTQTVNGCDSNITINLTIVSVDTTVSQIGMTLSANENGASYQWYHCEGSTMISGANAQTYTPTASGSYFVEIQTSVCTVNSSCYEVLNVGIDEVKSNVTALYPNPTLGLIHIDLDASYENVWLRVLNTDGRIVKSMEYDTTDKIQFELDQANGLYTILIYANNELSVFKVIKAE